MMKPLEIWKGETDYFIVLETVFEVLEMQFDKEMILKNFPKNTRGVIITAAVQATGAV